MAINYITDGKQTLTIEDAQLSAFVGKDSNWEICEGPKEEIVETKLEIERKANQVKLLQKDGSECFCDKEQVKKLLALGYKLPGEAKVVAPKKEAAPEISVKPKTEKKSSKSSK